MMYPVGKICEMGKGGTLFIITPSDLLGIWSLIYTSLDSAGSEVWASKGGILPPGNELLLVLVTLGYSCHEISRQLEESAV